jgi:hypothetical protein
MIKIFQQISQYRKELSTLEDLFKKYDIQAIQYQRDIRNKVKSNIDIKALDTEAYHNADRIKELRLLIQSKQEEISLKFKTISLKKII